MPRVQTPKYLHKHLLPGDLVTTVKNIDIPVPLMVTIPSGIKLIFQERRRHPNRRSIVYAFLTAEFGEIEINEGFLIGILTRL